jgi:hypothetical protein
MALERTASDPGPRDDGASMRSGHRRLRVAYMVPPGRFPTVVHDPGDWWGTVLTDPRFELRHLGGNAQWWRLVCESSPRASSALAAFGDEQTYATCQAYVDAVRALMAFIELCNAQVPALEITLGRGPRVPGLDYSSSAALTAFALRDSPLARSIDALLDRVWLPSDVLLLVATSPDDLLSAAIIADRARKRSSDLHVGLVDHGYENFSLGPHLPALRNAHTLDTVFDTILESKDERDAVTPRLLAALWAGASPAGYLRASDLPPAEFDGVRDFTPPSPVPDVFTPTGVLWTRVSPRRCYWNRCAFCVQNVKFDDPNRPSTSEVDTAIDRLSAQRAAGYRIFYLSDEALSPHFLHVFCEALLARGLDIRWACRCKMESSFSPDLAATMARAGCYEVLFGIETVSPGLLQRMDKYVSGMDDERTRDVLHLLNRAGIGIHINLIAGFPGAIPRECERDVAWTIETARSMRSTTFTYNVFRLFAGAPMLERPERFGIEPIFDQGDIATSYRYHVSDDLLADHLAINERIPTLAARLDEGLGWTAFDADSGARAAMELYHGSGHGSIMKAAAVDPFSSPAARRFVAST